MRARSLSFLSVCLLSAFASASQDKPGDLIRQELSEPFCYFSAPTDQIGFKEAPKATIITPDGAFLSAFGELSFYAGAPGSVRPVNKRVKTFLNNYIPVISYEFDRDGLHYAFEAFATSIDLDPKDNLITFIQCTVTNAGKSTKSGVLGVNFGDIASKINEDPNYAWSNGQRVALKESFRAQRSTEWHTKAFMDAKYFEAHRTEKSDIAFKLSDGEVYQGNHLVYVGPAKTAIPGMPSFKSNLKEAAEEFNYTLKPGEKKVLRFKMPAVPVSVDRYPSIKSVLTADHDAYRAKTIAFWKSEVAKADRFGIEDPKVVNTFRTSLVNDLIAVELNNDGHQYQRVNKLHYNWMWIRDSAFFVRTYDMLGMHDLAKEVLHAFMVWDNGKPVGFFKPGAKQPSGARISVQEDYWGQVLWAVGSHCRTTGDTEFLKLVYPLLDAHIDEFVAKCKADPRGLWPVAGPYDNEAINGHYTGHSFWALLGLKYAVYMAEQMKDPDHAAKWKGVHHDYETLFMKQLRELAAKSENYIPPGMDNVNDGNDWDNASGGIYPFEVLSKTDPLALETLKTTREFNYQEGIMTYGGNAWVAKEAKRAGKPRTDPGTLHHYETFYVTESNTVLGEQKKVVEDLYAILAHTGSTNSGFEFSIPAWSTRDPQDNFTPHGWFASRYMSQIRDALIREEGKELHLASVLAPKWVEPGKHVTVKDAPTFFGPVSYDLSCKAKEATLTLKHNWRKDVKPSTVVVHIPWFVKVSSATVDGKSIKVENGAVRLPISATKLNLKWSWTEKPNLSYERAVRLFLEKFYRKPKNANYDFLF